MDRARLIGSKLIVLPLCSSRALQGGHFPRRRGRVFQRYNVGVASTNLTCRRVSPEL